MQKLADHARRCSPRPRAPETFAGSGQPGRASPAVPRRNDPAEPGL